jgi:extracellular elastinolytic metalloproteinase
VDSLIAAHKAEIAEMKGDEGVWAIVKTAAQAMLGGFGGEKKVVDHRTIRSLYKQIHHLKHQQEAVCGGKAEAMGQMLTPVEALLTLLPRLHADARSLAELRLEDFHSTPEHTLAPKAAPAEPPTEHISGPGLATAGIKSSVPARLMFTQTSEGAPRMVWKMEVEMQDNWYEAYVDVLTGELLRVVDWASDYTWDTPKKAEHRVEAKKGGKQKPLPAPPTKYKPYTYQVFPWGKLSACLSESMLTHRRERPRGWQSHHRRVSLGHGRVSSRMAQDPHLVQSLADPLQGHQRHWQQHRLLHYRR